MIIPFLVEVVQTGGKTVGHKVIVKFLYAERNSIAFVLNRSLICQHIVFLAFLLLVQHNHDLQV